MITGEQVKAARKFLGWSQLKLAMKIKTQLNDTAVREFETEQRPLSPKNLELVKHALEAAGLEFTNGGQPGVRLRKAAMTREQFDLPIAHFARGGLPGLHLPRGAPTFPLELVLSDGVYLLKLKDDEGKVLGRISFGGEGPVYEPPLAGRAHTVRTKSPPRMI